MPKLTRVTQKQFGDLGPTGDFGQFGSLKAGAPLFTKDPSIIQALSNFLNGWGDATVGNYDPPLEDMNSLFYLLFRQLIYIFQEGVAEWDTNQTYYIGGLVKVNGVLYRSLVDANIGNNPATSTANWEKGLGGLNGGVPVGAILPWGGDVTNIPTGYLYGDGSAINRITYASLFSVYNTKYGIGDGTTTFNLPNGRGRNLIGYDGTADFSPIGKMGGVKTIDTTHNHQGATDGVTFGTSPTGVAGANTAHDLDFPHFHGIHSDGNAAQSILNPFQVTGGIIVKY